MLEGGIWRCTLPGWWSRAGGEKESFSVLIRK
jgi:hypothetical protein